VGQTALVTRDFDDGARLVQELDRGGFPVSAAFWAYDSTLESWRLIVAAPSEAIESRSKVYGVIQNILLENDLGIALSSISLTRDDDQGVRNLQAEAMSDVDTVFEVPLGRAEIGGRSVSNIHVYRTDALRYERELLAALQRVQPSDAVLRRANYLDFLPRVELDFVLDNGRQIVFVEAKAQSKPLSSKQVQQAQALQSRLDSYFHKPTALIVVSQRGFTRIATDWAQRITLLRLVKWFGPEDDGILQQTLIELLG
jgi:hypothetical protein